MDPISNTDRIALLLRRKLLERARAAGANPADRASNASTTSTGLVRALAALEDADERVRRRAVVQNILVEQFGDDMVNAAPFQQTIERVTDAIGADPEASAMLAQAIAALRSK